MVIRAPAFGGIKGGIWHSQSIESYYVHGGGIKIVCPSTPQHAYSLMLAAIRDPDPVLVIEPVPLYRALSGEVDDNGEAADIGVAEIVRPGSQLTALTYGPLRHSTAQVAEELATSHGIDAEVIDLVSLIPYDIDLVTESVNKTGRLVIIHEASETLGFGAEIAARVQHRSFGYLQAPIERVCAPDVPYSYRVGDEYCRPNADRIRAGIIRVAEYSF
jgi:pyruvate/2-oxoglutarate/acetoin dehydrogenase E1 component